MITICIPTLKRYDLLQRLIDSADTGEVIPDRYLVVDNGGMLAISHPKLEIYNPGINIGVATAWNWLIRNSEEIRIICNDDIEMYPNTLKMIMDNYDEKKILFPLGDASNNIYSFFTISDYIVNLVGYFDESISPGYGYFEDNDYDFRIKAIRETNGEEAVGYLPVQCDYFHAGSATFRSFNLNEENQHHQKFRLARNNFLRKWGRLPDGNAH